MANAKRPADDAGEGPSQTKNPRRPSSRLLRASDRYAYTGCGSTYGRKDIYILLMLNLLCWPRPVASLAAARRLTGDALPRLTGDVLACLTGDALLALLGWQLKRGLLTTPAKGKFKTKVKASKEMTDGERKKRVALSAQKIPQRVCHWPPTTAGKATLKSLLAILTSPGLWKPFNSSLTDRRARRNLEMSIPGSRSISPFAGSTTGDLKRASPRGARSCPLT